MADTKTEELFPPPPVADLKPEFNVRPEDYWPAVADRPAAMDGEEAMAIDRELGRLTLADRKQIVDQAIVLLQDNYAHLPLKRAMHAVNPVQLLKLLRLRLENMREATMPSEILFHRELHAIFHAMRDLHTSYILPLPYKRWHVFLPFTIAEHFEEAKERKDCLLGECESDEIGEQYARENGESVRLAPRYTVIHLLEPSGKAYEESQAAREKVRELRAKLAGVGFGPGARILFWNGAPIVRALQLVADQFAGSNDEARRARGLSRMTLRPLAHAMPPDEVWVEVVYQPVVQPSNGNASHELEEGEPRALRFYWAFAEEADPALPEGGSDEVRDAVRQATAAGPLFAPPADEARIRQVVRGEVAPAIDRGVDHESVTMRLQKYRLYVSDEKYAALGEKSYSGLDLKPLPELTLRHSTEGLPVLEAFSVEKVTEQGATHFGLIRIRTFGVDDIDRFVDHFEKVLHDPEIGRHGLILDVRGNGGGRIPAGERLLQLLTPRRIEPARFQMLSSSVNLELCRRHPELAPWIESLASSVTTGDVYSRGLTLSSKKECNDRGQRYHGPTILITDARCYSTTDIFAAGFQDHGIGKILGVHGNTGAGGANNVAHADLLAAFGARGPYRKLPRGAELSVSLRRSMRVLERSGVPLEDLGVKPDHRYWFTRQDLLEHNQDLYAKAVELLERQGPPYLLYGWRDSENEKKLKVCHSVNLKPDFLLRNKGTDAQADIQRMGGKRPIVEVDGIKAKVLSFKIVGKVKKEDLLQVKGFPENQDEGNHVVASLKTILGEISTQPPFGI